MIRLFSLAVTLAALSGSVSAAAIGPDATLEIANQVIGPDGYLRSATLAGGTFPGPLIKGNKGDRFAINVRNSLVDKSMDLVTSIHWHGLLQRHTNYADGAAFVTQCPIVPNESFNYQFNSEDQAGTYWYHSHYQAQYCDGLRGPFVIYDKNDPHRGLYDIDNESTVITLADWYHYVSGLAPLAPVPDSTLINGQGRYNGGPASPLAVVNVTFGLRYRLRLVSISCDPAYYFSIDKHPLTIIEVDGVNVQPVTVQSLQIFAGQRYSVVLNANQLISNYWIRALPNVGRQSYANHTNVAVLHYGIAAPSSIFTLFNNPQINVPLIQNPLKETNLHPLVRTPVPGKPIPGGADININLAVELRLKPEPAVFLVNNSTFTSPDVPILLQILSGKSKPSDLLPKGTIYGLEANKSVEITIPAGAPGGPHPIHLHGHTFHVIRSAGSNTYNYDNPVERDVVSIGDKGDNVTIRFFTDNPGPWFLHCHIDWHLERGFAVVFAENVPDIPPQVKPTADWDKLCPSFVQFNSTKQ